MSKNIWITGASSGIGKSIALNLAAKGAKVVLAARREEKLKKIVENIIQDGGEASYVVADVQHRTDLAKLVSIALAEFGKLDVMINREQILQ